MPGVSGLPAPRGPLALMAARVQVIGLAHPFRFDYKRCEVRVGKNIWGCLEPSGCPPLWATSAVVHLNDVRAPLEWWGHTRPKAGSTLTYKVMPKGGLLRAVLTLGIIVSAALLGPALAPGLLSALGVPAVSSLFGGLTTAVGAGISAATGRGGTLRVNALPPARVEGA